MGRSVYICPGCDGLVEQIEGIGEHRISDTPCRYNHDFIKLHGPINNSQKVLTQEVV